MESTIVWPHIRILWRVSCHVSLRHDILCGNTLVKVLVLQAGTVAILHANCVRIEWFQKFCQNLIIYLIIAWSNSHSLMKTGQLQRVIILYKSIDKPRPWMNIYRFIGNRCKINNIVTRSKSSSYGFIFFFIGPM